MREYYYLQKNIILFAFNNLPCLLLLLFYFCRSIMSSTVVRVDSNQSYDTIIRSFIDIYLTELVDVADDKSHDKVCICLPPMESSFLIYLDLIFDDILISKTNTPRILSVLFEMLKKSNLWNSLFLKSSILIPENSKNSFIIVLNDNLFDVQNFNDLLSSPLEQYHINNIKLKLINSIYINCNLKNLKSFSQNWYNGNLIKDLNYCLFNQFLKMEIELPLIFNHNTRSIYFNLKTSYHSVINSCLKSNQTYIIEQRAVLSGILKNLFLNSKDWLTHVNSMDWKQLKKERKKSVNDSFTITWLVK